MQALLLLQISALTTTEAAEEKSLGAEGVRPAAGAQQVALIHARLGSPENPFTWMAHSQPFRFKGSWWQHSVCSISAAH